MKSARKPSAAKTLHRWNVSSAKKVGDVSLGGEGFKPARLGDALLVPCADHRLARVDTSKNTVVGSLQGHTDWVLSVAVSPDQTKVVAGAYDGQLRLWNAAGGNAVASWSAGGR